MGIKIVKYPRVKLSETEAKEVFDAIGRVCNRLLPRIKEYEKNKNICIISDVDGWYVYTIFQQINEIFAITGETEPFMALERRLKEKIEYAKMYIITYKYDEYLYKIYHYYLDSSCHNDSSLCVFEINKMIENEPEYFIECFGNEIEILEKNLR